MASQKVSELTAVTSTDNASLVYVADTQDSGSSYAGRKITKANLFSGYATESYVDTAVSNLVDGAPDALNTLNEIAAAISDDASIATTLTALATANEVHIDNVVTLSGVAKDATNLGAFSGSTVADNQTIKAALQALETAVETKGTTDAGDNVNTLVASTSAQSVPSTYYFLVVDQSDGSIKVIDKNFVEVE